MSDVINVTDENFEEEVLNSKVPVVIDFWATWCGPCKALAPIFSTVAEELKDKAKFVKINVDVAIETTKKFSVRGIPTIVVTEALSGTVLTQGVGSKTKIQLTELVNEAIK